MKLALTLYLMIAGIAFSMAAEISGKIVNGLRVLSEDEIKTGNITLYRGDYAVFPAEEGKKTTLKVNELKIDHVFPPKEGEKNYVKFKKAGSYDFIYGDINGKVDVVEYTQPNYHALNAAQAKETISNISPLILDVRTPDEYEQGHIEGSLLIPVQLIQRDYTKILDYKDKPVLIYCATGNRSTVAAKILIDNGFKNIYNMRYGIADWAKSGFPVSKTEKADQ